MPETPVIPRMSPGHFFPDQLAVYPIRISGKVQTSKPSLLHANFNTPLSPKDFDQLIDEIAGYLEEKEKGTVYSFFTKSITEVPTDIKWLLKCCRLNRNTGTQPAEVVIFTYDLDLLEDLKEKLYNVLENDDFFKENLEKIARLTGREKEIIRLLSQGLNNKQIAEVSYTSVHTVTTHRRNINRKLATQNFPELLKLADTFDLNGNK